MTSILIGITAILTAACIATSVLRGRSAALRHVVWTCAIAATLLLAPLRWRAPQRVVSRPLPVVFAPTLTAAAARMDRTPDLTAIALVVWAMGAAFVALPLLVSALQLRRVVRNAHTTESAFPVPILTSPHIAGPLVAGILRPVILLPDSASTWTPSRRRAVLAHELAHVRRRDPLILLAAHLATVVYWFHPLCWLAAARLRIESERACDDAALRIGLLPSGYAGHLLDLARAFKPQPAIPMATTSHLESRVKSILDPFVNRSFAAGRTWLAAALLTAAVMAPFTTLSLHAQQATGTGNIVGRVVDPTGAVVPRARIVASNADTHTQEVTTSGADGSFALNNIPAGRYSIEVQVPGFMPFQRSNLNLANGNTARADATLALGGIFLRTLSVAPGVARPLVQTDPASQKPLRVGGMVQPAKVIFRADPVYPPDLQARGIEGTVMLQAVISKEGAALSINPLNTAVNPEFVTAAEQSVAQWRFQPSLLNGEPVETTTTVTVEFKLQQ